MLRTPLIIGLAAALTTAHSLHAQCASRQSRGPFAGLPIVTVMRDEPGLSFNQTYLIPAGLDGTPPAEWPAGSLPPDRPDFDMRDVFRGCGVSCAPLANLEVDAISMGEDWVLADCNGQVDVPAGRWAAVLFSLTRSSQGRPGSTVSREAAAGLQQSSVFSYVLPGSALPPELVDATERAQEASEMGLSSRADLTALDMFIPFYTLDDRVANPSNHPTPGMMPPTASVFFSLTSASAAQAPACWFTQGGPSGATILRSNWDARSRTWSCPQPWMTYRDLELEQREDIDALAIDLDNQHMLLSTDISIVSRNPILYSSWDPACQLPDAATTVYITPTGDDVSEAIGLTGADDVDAICAMDPSIQRRRGRAPRPNNTFYVHGTPQATLPGAAMPAPNGSAFRKYDAGTGQLRYQSIMVGWPAGAVGAGWGVLLLTPTGLFAPNLVLGVIPRDPSEPFCGDPAAIELIIPPIPGLVGANLMFRWFAVDGATVAEAHPVIFNI